MFENLQEITPEQVDAAAVAMQRDEAVFFRVDPDEVYVVFTPAPDFEMDFNCVRKMYDGTWSSTPLTPLQLSIIKIWTEKAWALIHARWVELSEERTPHDQS